MQKLKESAEGKRNTARNPQGKMGEDVLGHEGGNLN